VNYELGNGKAASSTACVGIANFRESLFGRPVRKPGISVLGWYNIRLVDWQLDRYFCWQLSFRSLVDQELAFAQELFVLGVESVFDRVLEGVKGVFHIFFLLIEQGEVRLPISEGIICLEFHRGLSHS
jgi:hypothetical protein